MNLFQLKMIFRQLSNKKFYSFLKIGGLAIGLTAFLLIAAYVHDDLTWDRIYPNFDRLYVLRMNSLAQGEAEPQHTTTPSPLGPAILRDSPEVEAMSRYERCYNLILLNGEEPAVEEAAYWVDPDFLKMFSVQLLEGNPQTVLNRPDAILLSQSKAKVYFGNENPVGRRLNAEDGEVLQVTGVFKAPESKSHLHFEILRPVSGWLGADDEDSWQHGRLSTYVLLRPGSDPKNVNREFAAYDKYLDPEQNSTHVDLLPLREIHLSRGIWIRHNADAGNPLYTWMFGSAAALILLIAMVNYVNISTAQSLQRTREIGLRKVIGARRSMLIMQFIAESIIFALAAAVLASLIIELIQKSVEAIAGREIGLQISSPSDWGVLAALAVVMGLLAGFYPAIILSGFKPIQSLKGESYRSPRVTWLRRGLVGLQFAISIILIIATIVVRDQLHYMQTADRGFDSKQVMSITIPRNQEIERLEDLRTRIAGLKGVEEAGLAFSMPGRIDLSLGIQPEGETESWIMDVIGIDDRCLPLFNFKLLEGRFYSIDYPGDYDWEGSGGAILLNERAVRELGWKHPLGKSIVMSGKKATIVGVVKDFHTGSLHDPIQPIILADIPFGYRRILARIDQSNTSMVLKEIKEVMMQEYPSRPFLYDFLDEKYQRYYDTERRSENLLEAFSAVALLLTLLGIIGLTSYSASRRVREIGIRKVLGANVPQMIGLLTREVMILIIAGSAVALPLAFWLSDKWLENFAFRINFPIWSLPIAVVLTLLLAGISAGLIGWRAALTNPATALHNE